MFTRAYSFRVVVTLLALSLGGIVSAAENPFIGAWELTLPGGSAGWLGVQETGGHIQASVMWVAGSVEPVASAKVEDGRLILTRHHTSEQKVNGKSVKKTITETITATR